MLKKSHLTLGARLLGNPKKKKRIIKVATTHINQFEARFFILSHFLHLHNPTKMELLMLVLASVQVCPPLTFAVKNCQCFVIPEYLIFPFNHIRLPGDSTSYTRRSLWIQPCKDRLLSKGALEGNFFKTMYYLLMICTHPCFNIPVVVKSEHNVFYALSTVLENGFGHLSGDFSRILAYSFILPYVYRTILHHGSVGF